MTQMPRIPPSQTVPGVSESRAALVKALRVNPALAELHEVMRMRNARVLDCFG